MGRAAGRGGIAAWIAAFAAVCIQASHFLVLGIVVFLGLG
jgi:hypothetical protein